MNILPRIPRVVFWAAFLCNIGNKIVGQVRDVTLRGHIEVLPYYIDTASSPYVYHAHEQLITSYIKTIGRGKKRVRRYRNASGSQKGDTWIAVHAHSQESSNWHARGVASLGIEKFPEYLPLILFKSDNAHFLLKQEGEVVTFTFVDDKVRYHAQLTLIYKQLLDDPLTLKEFWRALLKKRPHLKNEFKHREQS